MNYLDNNDYELMYLISEKNDMALDILFKKYDPLIKKVANHYFYMFKSYSITIEELEQEGRIGLYKAIKKFDVKKDILFWTFAFFCIKKQILSLYVNCSRKKNEPLKNYVLLEEQTAVISNDNLQKAVEDNEFYNFIINFKNELKFIDANIFELRYNYFSYKDIACLLGISKKTVDNKIVFIKTKLKKYMLENNLVI